MIVFVITAGIEASSRILEVAARRRRCTWRRSTRSCALAASSTRARALRRGPCCGSRCAVGRAESGQGTVLKLRAARERKRRRDGRCEGRKPFGHAPGESAVLYRIRTLRRKPKGRRALSVAAIAATLNAEGRATRTGKPWAPGTVYGILQRISKKKLKADVGR